MTIPLSKLNLKNTDSKQFKDCADLFLDCVEQKLDVKFNHRQRTRDILVELLAYYCLPNPERGFAQQLPKECAKPWLEVIEDGQRALLMAQDQVRKIRRGINWAKRQMNAGEPSPFPATEKPAADLFSGQNQ